MNGMLHLISTMVTSFHGSKKYIPRSTNFMWIIIGGIKTQNIAKRKQIPELLLPLHFSSTS